MGRHRVGSCVERLLVPARRFLEVVLTEIEVPVLLVGLRIVRFCGDRLVVPGGRRFRLSLLEVDLCNEDHRLNERRVDLQRFFEARAGRGKVALRHPQAAELSKPLGLPWFVSKRLKVELLECVHVSEVELAEREEVARRSVAGRIVQEPDENLFGCLILALKRELASFAQRVEELS